ncbi:hypothetical protein OJ253_2889 [Cryptosporidium canis]|uniref:Uncharacterized protein n=1 Tax=Cryptosporidium canis TaxID=195482 RepID=A0A9D5HXS6_9CRYT|nr:hypothetical protein OJ253_2889 [Cryptosporidium canis]
MSSRWLLLVFSLLIAGTLAPCLAEGHYGEGVVKLVNKEVSPGDSASNTQEQPPEAVVELESTDESGGASGVHSPEQVYEACMSLQESFKDCDKNDVSPTLARLVEACSDSVLNTEDVVSAAIDVAESHKDSDILELDECSTMVFASGLFISSANQDVDQDDGASLEVESMETESSHMESESEDS